MNVLLYTKTLQTPGCFCCLAAEALVVVEFAFLWILGLLTYAEAVCNFWRELADLTSDVWDALCHEWFLELAIRAFC